MAGDAIGFIACGCGLPAAIKKIKNSENLYSHCSKCGCDRRTGEHIQAKFRAAVGVMELPENSEVIPEGDPEEKLSKALGDKEWKPTIDTHKNAGGDEAEVSEKSGVSTGRKILATAVLLGTAAGILYKALRA